MISGKIRGTLFLYLEYYLQKDDFGYLLSNLSKVSSLDELKTWSNWFI